MQTYGCQEDQEKCHSETDEDNETSYHSVRSGEPSEITQNDLVTF